MEDASFFPQLSLTSSVRARWQFDEASPVPAQYFCETFESYQLEGRILPTAGQETGVPRLLAIHGARSDYTKLNALLYPLQAMGISSLSFNLSGHNVATGVALEKTSLGNNLRESLRFADRMGAGLYAVLGHSMGGALALKVAQRHGSRIKKIVLCCPALYAEDAYCQPFGVPFKAAIAKPFGFLDSLSLEFLREFDGDLMLIMGQYDGLKSIEFGSSAGTSAGMVTIEGQQRYSAIPFEVVDAIEKTVRPGRFRKIVLPGCDHAISAWLRAHPLQACELAQEVADFLTCAKPIRPVFLGASG